MSDQLTEDEIQRMLDYCEMVKDSMWRVDVFANWQIKAMRELLTLRAENALLRGELGEWRAVAKQIHAEADEDLRVTVWAMAMLNVLASGEQTPTEFDSTVRDGA